jgi:hypothetical protein
MKEGLLGDTLRRVIEERAQGGPFSCCTLGLDLSRRRLDVCLLSGDGEPIAEFAAPADADGLRGLSRRRRAAGARRDRVDERRLANPEACEQERQHQRAKDVNGASARGGTAATPPVRSPG